MKYEELCFLLNLIIGPFLIFPGIIYLLAISTTITCTFTRVSREEYKLGVNKWSSVYQDTKMIPGTQKYHSFIPISETTIVTRLYSNDNARSTHTIFKNLKL